LRRFVFFFSSRRRHTRFSRDWSSDVCSSDLRNILVFVDLPRHAELKAGTFARGAFDLGQAEALTVASASVVVRDGHNYVFVIDRSEERRVGKGCRARGQQDEWTRRVNEATGL